MKKTMPESIITTINVKGMHCSSCEMLITDALEEKGAKNVSANHKTGEVVVEHNKSLSKDAIRLSIMDEGYEVED